MTPHNNPKPRPLIPGRTRAEVAKSLGLTVREVENIERAALLRIGYAIKTAALTTPAILELIQPHDR
jgi:transcriptional regulator